MFFGNSRISFLKISWVDCEQYGKNQYKKGTQLTRFSVVSIKIIFILFICHRSFDNPIDFYLLSCLEKAHDNKEFCHENSEL